MSMIILNKKAEDSGSFQLKYLSILIKGIEPVLKIKIPKMAQISGKLVQLVDRFDIK